MGRDAICPLAIIVHAKASLERAPSIPIPILGTAIFTTVVLDASQARALNVFAALLVLVIMVVDILVTEVIDKDVPNLSVRAHLLCEVDNSVFDDVPVHTVHMVGLVAAQDGMVAIQALDVELAELVGLEPDISVLHKGILNGEVDA
jgi:hypothetical protein